MSASSICGIASKLNGTKFSYQNLVTELVCREEQLPLSNCWLIVLSDFSFVLNLPAPPPLIPLSIYHFLKTVPNSQGNWKIDPFLLSCEIDLFLLVANICSRLGKRCKKMHPSTITWILKTKHFADKFLRRL